MSKAILTLRLWDDEANHVPGSEPDLIVSTGEEGQFTVAGAVGPEVTLSSAQALSLSRFFAENAKAEDS